jgi:hypothetical protein
MHKDIKKIKQQTISMERISSKRAPVPKIRRFLKKRPLEKSIPCQKQNIKLLGLLKRLLRS